LGKTSIIFIYYMTSGREERKSYYPLKTYEEEEREEERISKGHLILPLAHPDEGELFLFHTSKKEKGGEAPRGTRSLDVNDGKKETYFYDL